MTTNTEMSLRTENDTDDGQRQGRWKRHSALKNDTEHGNDPDDDAENHLLLFIVLEITIHVSDRLRFR
jgi:hypothetical protein